MRVTVAVGMLTILLAGCATHPPQQKTWIRKDGLLAFKAGQEFEVAKEICLPRAEAASIAGTAAVPIGYGMGGAIASGIESGIKGAQIKEATIMSCMAEQGFLFVPQDVAEERDAALRIASAPPITARRK